MRKCVVFRPETLVSFKLHTTGHVLCVNFKNLWEQCYVTVSLYMCSDMDNIRLIFADEHLDDDTKLLSDYGVQHMSVIQITIRVDGGLTV